MKPTKFVKSSHFFEEDATGGIAEVPAGGNAPGPEQAQSLGKAVDRYEAYDKVTGTARYSFDVSLPGMLHAVTLRSPHPHARIRSINTSKAEKMPGVIAIHSHENTDQISWYGDSYLYDPHLRYEGDEVACVAAVSEQAARRAVAAIEVDYEILPFETRTLEAVKPDSPAYHRGEDGQPIQETGGGPRVHNRGDVEAGFAEADEIVEASFSSSVLVHNPTEAHGSVVRWDGGKLKVWDSTQGIYRVRDSVASKLGLPASRVEVMTPVMGGGFGAKLEAGKYTVMAALLARETGRPVRIFLDREEMNLAVGNRPDSHQTLKMGVSREGRLVAASSTTHGMAGAYSAGAGVNWPFLTLFKCDNLRSEQHSVFTNLGRARPFRAPGHPQGMFALAQMMDELAERINMDPLELRKRNHIDHDQVFGVPYTSKQLQWCYDEGAKAIGWERRNQPAGSGSGPIRRGIGMASQIWWGGGGPPAGVTAKMNHDGTVRVFAGSQDIGTGTYTFLRQTVAEALGIDPGRIDVTLGETSTGPYGPSSGGSTTAPSLSPAAWDAGVQLRQALIEGAAAVFDATPEQVVYKNGRLSLPGTDKALTTPELLREMNVETLVRTGLRAENPSGKTVNSFGAQFAEVEVDMETGKVTVLRIVTAHDIGRTLNRKLLENQFEGGIIQGLGMALFEERLVDDNTGQVISTNLHDYKLPTVMDSPEITVLTAPNVDTTANSLGVKGIGEPPIIPTSGAIANAVYNATGVRMRELPMTPDRVLTALLEADAKTTAGDR